MANNDTEQSIARIERLALQTGQPERLRDFYADRLGALVSPLYQDPHSGRRAIFLDFCGVGLELIEPPADLDSAPHRNGAGWVQIAFALGSADAVDRLTAGLAAAGHPIVEPPHRSWEGSYQSVLLDPDGNRIELTV
jgi:lactoylglutathione lyase